jgi:hypothetical protein
LPTYTTNTTYATGLAHSTCAADTTYTAYSAGPAHSTYAANSADSAGSTDTTHTAGPAHSTHTTGDGVAIETIEVVDINIATAPAATPSRTTTPPRSHQHSSTEGKRGACRVVAGRIIHRRIWIHRFTVYRCRLIRRHVHNFWISWLDDNHALVVNYLCFHSLLLRSVQSAFVLRLPAHPLNGIHHVALVCKEDVAEISSPLNVVSQKFHDFR